MTDLIERVEAAFVKDAEGATGERSPADQGRRHDPHADRSTTGAGQGIPLSVPILLSVTLGGSAALLVAMTSGHLTGAKATVGVIAALLAVGAAVAVITRPSRALFSAIAAGNAAIAAYWVVVEGPRAISTTTAAIGVALAATAVVVAGILAIEPAAGRTWSSATAVLGSVLPVALVAVTIVALFSTTTPAAPVRTASAAPKDAGGAAAALALATSITVPGENSKTFQSVVAGNETEQSELQKYVPLPPNEQAELTQQLSEAEQAAERFPTVASAKAAGMILAGGMAPGVGAHYQIVSADTFKGINPDGTVNPLFPASWIYASTANNAPVVGVMYESMTNTAPTGFVGPNDHWHRHSNVCVQFNGGKIGVPFAADQDVTPQECKDAHGTFMKKTVWMVHAWVVPGWESPQGVFSHDNLHVYCPGNTDITDAIGFCVRQS